MAARSRWLTERDAKPDANVIVNHVEQIKEQLPTLGVSVLPECSDENVFAEKAIGSPKESSSNKVSPETNKTTTVQQNQLSPNGNVANTSKQQLLAPPNPSSRLQVPSATASQQPSTSSLPGTSRPGSALSSKQSLSNAPKPSPPPPAAPTVIPLGLKEVTDNCRKEYLQSLFKIVKINAIVLVVGTALALAGIGMMVYSAIMMLSDYHSQQAYSPDDQSDDEDLHQSSALESLFERLGAVLAGIGAFVNMVSIVFILDRRAILNRERMEKIDTYKKNRQQPRNIFEILLANAKQRAMEAKYANAESVTINENAIEIPVPSAVVTTTINPAKTPSVKGGDKLETASVSNALNWRRPSVSSAVTGANSVRQRLGSTSMAKAMADITTQQLKLFSKSKGNDVEVYVLSHHPPRPTAPGDASPRGSVSSSQRRRLASGAYEMPEGALQIHRSLEEWLKSSVQHTVTHEFATELEPDAESDTMSLSLESERGGSVGGAASPPSSRSLTATPEPTRQDIANPDGLLVPPGAHAKPHRSKQRTVRTLPGSNIPIRNVFQQMFAAQKTQTIYDAATADRETPLPPPVRVSAHYARRQPPPLIITDATNPTTPGAVSGLTSARSQNRDQAPQSEHRGSSSKMWATATSGQGPTRSSKSIDPYRIQMDRPESSGLPPLPTSSSPTRSKPPLPRSSLKSGAGANSSNTGVGNNNERRISAISFKK